MFICLFTIVLTSCVPKQEVIPEEPPKEEIILPVWYKVSYVDSNDKQLAVEYVDEGEFAPEKDYTTYFKVGDHPGYEGGFFSLDGVNPYTYDQPIVSNTVLKAVLIKWNRQKMLNYILCSSWAGAQTKYVATVDSDISWGKISWDDAKLQLFLESADIKEFYLNCGLTGEAVQIKITWFQV
ncbi:MAG: hypothetical protein EZS28_048597 [Streblomastix strix]|uniref:Lipoprotein n=1 Tax=Streblomastix strix TaxID=222440 RepID=A0A5J4TC88_9EUKA|nr:MAG: hypothetical protein EZS28_048597 [Streblomastix strix]